MKLFKPNPEFVAMVIVCAFIYAMYCNYANKIDSLNRCIEQTRKIDDCVEAYQKLGK